MLALLVWLITFPSFVCHLLYVFCIFALIVSYKFYKFLRQHNHRHTTRLMMDKANKLIMSRRRLGGYKPVDVGAHLTLVVLMLIAAFASQQGQCLEQVSWFG